MGIFRDLVSNVANSRMKEEQQKLAYNQGLGDILTTLIQNPSTDPGTLSKASAYYVDLLGRHGGREGKALQQQIGLFLNAYLQRRAHDRAMGQQGQGQEQGGAAPEQPAGPYPAAPNIPGAGGGTQPQGETTAPPGSGAIEPRPDVPYGQYEGQPGGVNYGWPTGRATPASLAPGGAQAAQAAQGQAPVFPRAQAPERGGFRPVLRTLAGVGGEMLGVPRGSTQTRLPSKTLFAPTAEQAEEAARERYFQRLDVDVAAGRLTQDEAKEAKKTYDVTGEPLRAAAPRARQRVTLIYPDNTPVTLDQDPASGKFYNVAGREVTPPEGAQFAGAAARTSSTDELRQDKLQAKADELGKPKDKLTAQEKVEAIEGSDDDQAAEIIDGVKAGRLPPRLTGLSRKVATKVEAGLSKEGYDLKNAQNDFQAVQRWINTQNSTQQVRLRQATDFAFESLDLVDNPQAPGDDLIGRLRNAVPRTRFPILNKAALAAAKNGILGEDAAEAARNLDSQIADLQSEIAVVYKGGNSPTDRGLDQAQRILSSDWSDRTLRSAINLSRQNLRLRLNSIRNTGPAGLTPQGQRQYNAPSPPPAPGATTRAPAAPEAGKRYQLNGREIVPQGGRWVYKDTGEPAQ